LWLTLCVHCDLPFVSFVVYPFIPIITPCFKKKNYFYFFSAMHNSAFMIALAFSTFGYVCYLAITSSDKVRAFLSPEATNNVNHILFQRLTGVLIFGLLPCIGVIYFSGTNPIPLFVNKESLFWVLILSPVIIPMSYFNSKSPDNLAQYPQIRNSSWSAGLLTVSALSWIAYLIAYELLFRGFLLFSSLELLGYWPAIILNTGIYSLVHYPKGMKEALGAVPFGIIICVLTIKTGGLFVAFALHIILALSNEWFSLYATTKPRNHLST